MSGYLTSTDLEALWLAVTDPLYSRSIREAPDGFEAIGQAIAQFEQISAAANATAEELYVLPWSGQTAPPAGGAAKARCEVTLAREGTFPFAVVLDPIVTRVEEVAVDFGRDGPVDVRTGRRYALQSRNVFTPGEAGPLLATVEAERAGSGFNHPLGQFTGADGTEYAGALRSFFEPGAGLANENASIEPSANAHRLRAAPRADVPVPEHVGQQLQILTGANITQVRRVIGYLPPESDDEGGSLLLAPTAVLAVSAVGALAVGERVTQVSGAGGVLLKIAQGRAVIDGDTETDFGTGTLTGELTGATATVDAVEQGAQMTAETGVSWRVVPLAELGVRVSNPEPPAGGRDAVLDLLGDERGVRRASAEDDEIYRRRVATPLDVVSPAALLRTANRTLSDFGVECVLREVGTEAFPGIRYDGDDSYDLDLFEISGAATGTFQDSELLGQDAAGGALAVGRAQVRSPVPAGTLPQPLPAPVLVGVSGVGNTPFVSGSPISGLTSSALVAAPIVTGGPRPEDRLRVQLDYVEFRAFFLVGAPLAGLGEFGCAYDAGAADAYDAAPFHAFYDGFALTTAYGMRALWQALDEVRAGGVGFDLELDASAS